MATILLVEAILVCLFALPLGVLVVHARSGSALSTGEDVGLLRTIPSDLLFYLLTVLLSIVPTLLLARWLFVPDSLSHHELAALIGPYAFNTVGAAVLALEVHVCFSPLLLALAYLLGGKHSLGRLVFRIMVFVGPLIVLLIFPALLLGPALGLLLLALSIYGLGFLMAYAIAFWGRASKKWRLVSVWTGFYFLCALVAFMIGRLGLLLIFMPAVLGFLVALRVLAGLALPTESASDRWSAFRALLTFGMTTNFPFYYIEDWQTRETRGQPLPEPRVEGNPFRKYFSGPGVVLTDANHLGVLWDGFKFRVPQPGLAFTGPFEQLHAAVDLRPQLRVATIEAETADGIVTKTLIFAPHRIAAGGRQLELGSSYPYDEEALLCAVCDNSYIEHHFSRNTEQLAEEKLERKPWYELALMFAPPILKSLMVMRTCDELHKSGTTRAEIAAEFVYRLREQLADVGIELVGGGLSNINVSEEVSEQRIANWEAKWKCKIEIELGKEEAEITRKLDSIWAEAQLAVYKELADILQQAETLDADAIAFQLVDALATLPAEPKNVQELPPFMWSLMRRGRSLGGGRTDGRS